MTEPEKISLIQSLANPMVCEILQVEWAGATKYYAWARYKDLPVFNNFPYEIEARLLNNGFSSFEINGDLRSETFAVTLDDIDKDITTKFQTNGTVRCELLYFYPEADYIKSVWWGQLNQPQLYGLKQIQTTATNGFRSRELQMPRRQKPKECTSIFGGKFSNTGELYTNGCPYDKHLGGSLGLNDPNTKEPFTDCPRRSEQDCIERFGHARYYLGLNLNVPAIVTDPNTGYSSSTKGNTSILKQPISVIAGAVHYRNCKLLAYRLAPPDYVHTLWEVCEGNIGLLDVIEINGEYIAPAQYTIRNGGRGQATNGFGDVNVSGTCVFSAVYGRAGSGYASRYNNTNMSAFVRVPQGFAEIAVYSDDETYLRVWTVNRSFFLLEAYTNQRWGLGYSPNRFDIQSYIDTSDWTKNRVKFTDPNGNNYDGARTVFQGVLEGKPSADQISDICRSGRISIPFQHNGKYYVTPIAAVSDEVIENAKVFSDSGNNKNIVWESAMPSIQISQIPDEKLVNHVVVTYQDENNRDIERPITVDDPDQKARAGKVLGDNNFSEVPKRFNACGIRELNEAVKLAYSLMYFGEFDEGGLKNNLRVEFSVPFEQILDVKKYDVIKIESNLLGGFLTPEGNPFEYFRIIQPPRKQGGTVRITAQAYNKEFYETFETLLGTEENTESRQALPNFAPMRRLTFSTAPSFSDGTLHIPSTV